MNWGELKAAVRSYLVQRKDITDAIIITWQDLARARIGQTVRTLDLEALATVTLAAGLAELPSDFAELRRVSVEGEPLVYRSAEQMARMVKRGAPTAFRIEAGNLVTWPPADASAELVYFAVPERLESDTETNKLLTNAANLYLWGMLAEAFTWSQDMDAATNAVTRFNNEAALANAAASVARTAGGSMTSRSA
jgi:hypothetical protein